MNKLFPLLVKASVVVWIILSIAGLAGMFYKLWWQRDRVLYGGKSIEQQRIEVFKRAGLNPELLDDVRRLDQGWPAKVRYSLSGGGENQSYVKYLLVPRIPANDALYQATIEGDTIQAVLIDQSLYDKHSDPEKRWFGWPLSVFFVLALGWLFLKYIPMARLSVPESVGLSSMLVFGIITLSKALVDTAVYGAILLAIMGGIAGLLRVIPITNSVRAGICRMKDLSLRPFLSSNHTLMIACVLIIAAAFLLSMVLSVIVVPDDWDAWAIWGAKAKVLALGSGPLSDVTFFGQSDYPLLWPSVWAFSGWCSGGWEEQWSRGWGAIFLLLTAWQIGVMVLRITGKKNLALLSAAVLISIPKVIVVSSWSYAEGPLWLMMTCSFNRMLIAAQEGYKSDFFFAGCFAFAAIMTKNDGLYFAVLGFVWLFASCGCRKWRHILLYVVPLIAYLPWLWWIRVQLKLVSHAAEGLSLGKEMLFHAWGRLWPGCVKVIQIWGDFQQWSVILYILLAGMVILIWRGSNRMRLTLAFPLTMIAGLFLVEIFHSSDLYWLLGASWDRLTIQVLVLLIPLVIPAINRYAFEKEG